MNTALVKSLLFVLVIGIASTACAQMAAPFDSQTLLPAQENRPQWQSYPTTSAPAIDPAFMTMPHARYPAPSYYSHGNGPMTFSANLPQTPAVPDALQPNTVQPDVAVPAVPESGFSDCDPGVCCDEQVCCAPVCGPTWYAAASGLIFTRNRPRFSQLSYDDTDLVGHVLSTDSSLGQWDPGPEIRLGLFINPCWAVEFTYWGIYGQDEESTVYAANLAGNLNTALDFSPLNIGADNVNDLFDAAEAHRIRRDFDVNNFELNLIGGHLPCFDGNCVRITYLMGVRYLRFAEEFQFASADAVPVFGADAVNEAYYDIHVRNNLWGFQLGGRADWFWTPRFSIYAATKLGIYGNEMKQHSSIYNVNGIATVGAGNPLAGDAFDINSEKTLTSFLGELDLGLNFRITQCWSAVLGYRAVSISGLAYATDQIPAHLADLPGVADVDGNANMVLHGGYAGITFQW
jgi:hypothetical protein